MVIYGVALLSACTLAGLYLGEILGLALGVQANVGGVGFAMLLLMIGSSWLMRTGGMAPPTAQGIAFWNAIYIPIVVAMAAQQNVVAALSGGPAAILAGLLAVAAGVALVPVLDRGGRR
jgi:malonate transporter MadL subunit